MKWKNIAEIPSELINEDLFLRIETRPESAIFHAVGNISELEDVYAYSEEFDGFVSRDVWKNVWFVDPKEIEL